MQLSPSNFFLQFEVPPNRKNPENPNKSEIVPQVSPVGEGAGGCQKKSKLAYFERFATNLSKEEKIDLKYEVDISLGIYVTLKWQWIAYGP